MTVHLHRQGTPVVAPARAAEVLPVIDSLQGVQSYSVNFFLNTSVNFFIVAGLFSQAFFFAKVLFSQLFLLQNYSVKCIRFILPT